jgi:hypothetical protein
MRGFSTFLDPEADSLTIHSADNLTSLNNQARE